MNQPMILIVDDDTDICQLLSILLKTREYEIETFNNGQDALNWLQYNMPDLIVLDIMMPNMDGWTTFDHIRQLYDVPVIFLTAAHNVENGSRALRLGKTDYMAKPYHGDELIARVEALINNPRPVYTVPIKPLEDWIDQRPSVSVILPTLNEAQNLPLVLPYFPLGWVDEIILVDGLSTDHTPEVAKRIMPSIQVIMETKPGKGAALQAGYKAARGEIIVVMDCDGSNDPREIPRYVEALMEGADFVKGSRFAPGGGTTDMPLYRQLGNGVFVLMVNILFRATFTDLAYGFHAFWKYCLSSIDLPYANGFEIDTVLYLGALRDRLHITEVPSFEGFRFYGNGKLRTIPDGIRVLKAIIHEWWLSLKPSNQQKYVGFRGKPVGKLALSNEFEIQSLQLTKK